MCSSDVFLHGAKALFLLGSRPCYFVQLWIETDRGSKELVLREQERMESTHAQASFAATSAIRLRDGTDNFIVRIGDGELSVVGRFGRHCCRTEV